MLDCIIQSFADIYKILTSKQRLRIELKVNNGKKADHEIMDLIEVLNKEDLIEIKKILEPFKVHFKF